MSADIDKLLKETGDEALDFIKSSFKQRLNQEKKNRAKL